MSLDHLLLMSSWVTPHVDFVIIINTSNDRFLVIIPLWNRFRDLVDLGRGMLFYGIHPFVPSIRNISELSTNY